MKRIIMMAIAVTLIFSVAGPTKSAQSQKIYSLDEYDGYIRYSRGGINDLYLDNDLQVAYGENVYKPFVSFDLSQIDLARAKSITLHLFRQTGPRDIEIMVEPWNVPDQDYAYWQNCSISQWGNMEETIIARHEPKGCGFVAPKRVGPILAPEAAFPGWYEVIRYKNVNSPNSTFFMKSADPLNKIWQSSNILPIMREHFSSKQYVTFGFYPRHTQEELQNSLELVQFADGNPRNTIFRPYLEVRY